MRGIGSIHFPGAELFLVLGEQVFDTDIIYIGGSKRYRDGVQFVVPEGK